MKAKIRVDNVPQARRDVWDTMSEAYLRERMDAMTVALQSALTRRAVAAMYLAGSDQHGFGMTRGARLAEGVMEIIMGEAYEATGRGEEYDGQTHLDPTLDAMLCEMSQRGIYICYPGWDGYGSTEELRARLGDRYALRPSAAKRCRAYYVGPQGRAEEKRRKQNPPDAGTSDGQGKNGGTKK